MSNDYEPPTQPVTPAAFPPPPAMAAPSAAPVPVPGQAPAAYDGPLGNVRSTGTCVLLTIVTLGFYSLYWYYQVHQEMKRHSGQGMDGGIALLLGFFIGIVMAFITPNDVGALYERKGMAKPVSAITGLWALLLGWFFFVGVIVWFVKTNGALNSYWRSQGATG